MTPQKQRLAAKYYAAWLLLIWPSVAMYYYLPYYKNFLSGDAKVTLFYLALVYTLAAPAVYYLNLQKGRPLRPSRAYLALQTLRRLAGGYGQYLQKLATKSFYPAPEMTREERTNLLFMIVKLFFLPLMLNFLFTNINGLQNGIRAFNDGGFSFSLRDFNSIAYPFIFSVLLLIDTGFFAFGYAVESRLLNNRVVSVDPTFLGWFTALLCYPPLNGTASNYLPWHANDYAMFHSPRLTTLLYILVLALMMVYVSATVALGAKASNLTNRGIVDRWPYSFIRHPAYISKNLAWWLTLLPLFTPLAIISMAAWTFIYFLRAITEERHLMMVDNGYKEYAQKVRWRFIPGIL